MLDHNLDEHHFFIGILQHGVANLDTKIDGGTRPDENSLASLVALYSENTKSVFCGGAVSKYR